MFIRLIWKKSNSYGKPEREKTRENSSRPCENRISADTREMTLKVISDTHCLRSNLARPPSSYKHAARPPRTGPEQLLATAPDDFSGAKPISLVYSSTP